MRTTLDLDEAVLAAARTKARYEGISVGRAVSELALRGLRTESTGASAKAGIPVLRSVPGHVITDEMVEQALAED